MGFLGVGQFVYGKRASPVFQFERERRHFRQRGQGRAKDAPAFAEAVLFVNWYLGCYINTFLRLHKFLDRGCESCDRLQISRDDNFCGLAVRNVCQRLEPFYCEYRR